MKMGEAVRERGIDDRWVASDVLESVEPVTLSDDDWEKARVKS